MPFTEQVVIEFTSDTAQLDPAIDKLLAMGEIDQQTYETFKKNNQTFDARTKSLETYTELQEKIAGKTKISENNFVALSKAAKSMSDNLLTEGSVKFLDKLNSQIGVSTQELKDFEKGAIEGVKEALQEAGVSEEQFRKALEGTGKESKSLKTELLGLKTALAQMKLEGKSNTEEYENLRSKAGEIKDAIGDVNDEITRTGSDTSGIDRTISATTALVGGFQVAQGAMALLGTDNDKLQESFVRLQAGMSLLQGLQAVGNELSRQDSILKKGLAVANTLTAATQKALGVATVETSAGFKVLRAAIISTGIGALVVGVGLLIEHWDTLRKKGQELIDKFSFLRAVFGGIERAITAIGSAIGLMDDAATKKLKTSLEESFKSSEDLAGSLNNQADVLETIGGKSEKILAIRQRALLAEEEMLKKKLELAALNGDEEEQAKIIDELHKNKIGQLKLEDEILKFQVQTMRDQGKSEKEILEFQKQRINARINELEVIIKQAEALRLLEGGLFDTLRDGFVVSVNAEIEALRNKMDTVQTEFEQKAEKVAKAVKEKIKKVEIKVPLEFDDSQAKLIEALNHVQGMLKNVPPVELNARLAIESEDQGVDGVWTNRQKETLKSVENSWKLRLITTQQYLDKTAELLKEKADEEVRIQEAKSERLKQNVLKLNDFLASAAQTALGIEREKSAQQLDEALNRISTERAALDDMFKNKLINEQDYEKQKKIMEKNEKEAKMRAWQRDRQLAIFDIGIKTAQAAIASFVSVGGGPQGFLAALAATAFGGLQLAAVLSKKPPKFAVGTKNAPPGWKWVGEEGPELINTPGGEEIKTHKHSMDFAKAYSNIWEKHSQLSSLSIDASGKLASSSIDYNKMGDIINKAVGDAIAKLPISQYTFDRRGYSEAIRQGDRVMHDLGKKY